MDKSGKYRKIFSDLKKSGIYGKFAPTHIHTYEKTKFAPIFIIWNFSKFAPWAGLARSPAPLSACMSIG